MSKRNGTGCSLSLTTLTAVFVVLKLTGVIDWQWRYVLLPTLIEIALCLIVTIFLYIDE